MSDARLPAAASGTELLACLNAGSPTLPFARDVTLLHCHVAGTAYRELDGVVEELGTGEALTLRREPENPHDELAVRVLRADGTHLGYLPRACNEPVARLMDAGKLLVARLSGCARERRWLRLDVEVVLREL